MRGQLISVSNKLFYRNSQGLFAPGLDKQINTLIWLILSHLAVTITAIYWSTLPWLKRHFCILAALRTDCGKLLHTRSSAAPASFSLSGLAARLAALWFVSVPFLCKEFLLRSGEGELLSTINALDLLVGETH